MHSTWAHLGVNIYKKITITVHNGTNAWWRQLARSRGLCGIGVCLCCNRSCCCSFSFVFIINMSGVLHMVVRTVWQPILVSSAARRRRTPEERLAKIRWTNTPVNQHASICGDNFYPSCFVRCLVSTRVNLKKGSVPSRFCFEYTGESHSCLTQNEWIRKNV